MFVRLLFMKFQRRETPVTKQKGSPENDTSRDAVSTDKVTQESISLQSTFDDFSNIVICFGNR